MDPVMILTLLSVDPRRSWMTSASSFIFAVASHWIKIWQVNFPVTRAISHTSSMSSNALAILSAFAPFGKTTST